MAASADPFSQGTETVPKEHIEEFPYDSARTAKELTFSKELEELPYDQVPEKPESIG
jgi:hypothetical protein